MKAKSIINLVSCMKDKLKFTFIPKYTGLQQILTDEKLASLGDAYVNFVYSLALSQRKGVPTGARAKGKVLAEAFRRAGLKNLLPPRTDRHGRANAVEALVVYAWVHNAITIPESVNVLRSTEDDVEAFCNLIALARRRLGL